jgi:hypothetical protein
VTIFNPLAGDDPAFCNIFFRWTARSIVWINARTASDVTSTVVQCQNRITASFDHLVGAGEERRGQVNAEQDEGVAPKN